MIIRTISLPLIVRVEEDGDTASCTIETADEKRPLRFEVRGAPGDEDIIRAAAGDLREALGYGVAVIEAGNRGCACHEILREDRDRHFKGCELRAEKPEAPRPLLLWCPMCGARHIDRDEYATKPHHTHACQKCGLPWRPAIEPTVGVEYLPGLKDADMPEDPRAVVAALFGRINAALSPLTVVFAAIEAAEKVVAFVRGRKDEG